MKRSLLVVLALALSIPAAQARPLTVESDVSDNQFWFTYDSTDGDIERASSNRILRRRDRVAFLLYIRERADAALGERLVGRMELELLGGKARRYRGDFSFDVVDALGNLVFTGTQRANVLLRPREGRGVQVLRVPFDLPSGDYSTSATFESN